MKQLKHVILCLALILLVGCQTSPKATDASQAASNGAASQARESFAFDYTNPDGSKISLTAVPERIVSLSPTFSEVIYALDAGDSLVGRTDFCDYPQEIAKVPSVGSMTKPSVEKILEMKPDLVVVSFMEAEMVSQITKTGAKVMQIPSGESFEGSYKNMMELAKALNKEDKGKEITAAIQKDIDEVKTKLAKAEAKTCYYVAGFGKNGDYTAGEGTFMNDILKAAGGDNVAKDAQGWKYTAEKLVEKDPEYIFIGRMSGMTDAFKTTEPYKNLTAVKKEKVVELDDNLISREGPRMAQAVKAVAEVLHPDLMK